MVIVQYNSIFFELENISYIYSQVHFHKIPFERETKWRYITNIIALELWWDPCSQPLDTDIQHLFIPWEENDGGRAE